MADSLGRIECEEIVKLIPHRYPFLLIDYCHSYVEGQSIVGVKCVSHNEPFFQGHFPNRPLMPGVLIIEAMAQASAVLMSKTLNVDLAKAGIMFMSVENAKFRRPVRPGDVVVMNIEVTLARRNIYKFKGNAMVGDELVCDADWAAMKVDV
ncbi:MAG: 3R-hydroxymyristoyl ACP dehydrase [Hyphomonadaceae bacterium]|nr:MAG: 3R-hydroxymyristoyl ACP dehydrase [Hyphomonadaceae bacterium]KAF0185419.1 MAG: 3R-hydroxymyristoyl ACP dehydrase [Hyphomonadaceae bacterium]